MPGISVDAAVEKMVAEAPTTTVVDETPTPKAPAQDAPVEKVEKSETPDTDTKGEDGLTAFERELVGEYGEEYANVPEAQRPAFLSALKRSYRKQAKQMTELGNLRKAVGALRDAGVSNEDLVELIQKRKNKTPDAKLPSAAEVKRGFKRYLDESTDPAEREHVTKAEQVVRELVEDLVEERLGQRVKPLEEKFHASERQQQEHRAATLETEINELEDTHGFKGSLVETYRKEMLDLGLKNPRLSARKLLQIVATDEEYDHGRVVATSPEKREKPVEKSTPVVKKPAPEQLPRNTKGRVSVTNALDLLMSKVKTK